MSDDIPRELIEFMTSTTGQLASIEESMKNVNRIIFGNGNTIDSVLWKVNKNFEKASKLEKDFEKISTEIKSCHSIIDEFRITISSVNKEKDKEKDRDDYKDGGFLNEISGFGLKFKGKMAFFPTAIIVLTTAIVCVLIYILLNRMI